MPKYARAGSQKWLQVLVDRKPEVLLAALRLPLQLPEEATIDWVSPRATDGFCEYRDMAALRKLGVDALAKPLKDFWPSKGPRWDGLGKTTDGQFIFVEAKANISEAASPGTKATPEPLKLILSSLEEARRHYAQGSGADWSGTYYQYANRLAYHYFLREVNGLRSHIVFLYFINATDVNGPATTDAWRPVINSLHRALGLDSNIQHEGVHEIFIDVAQLRDAVG